MQLKTTRICKKPLRYGELAKNEKHGILNMLKIVFTNLLKLNVSSVGSTVQNYQSMQDSVVGNAMQDTHEENLERKILNTIKRKIKRLEKVYNIEVEDEHEYFANGILVHNCSYQEQIAYRPYANKYDNYVEERKDYLT